MSQTPITITYSLEEVLARLERKIDNIQEDVTELKVGQARLEEKVDGLGKRLDYQEFINRGVLIGLIVAILGGLAKILGLIGNP